MGRCLQAIKQAGPVTVLTFLGDDDAHTLEPRLGELAAKGLCVNLNGQYYREAALALD
jgi:hypothetical protein